MRILLRLCLSALAVAAASGGLMTTNVCAQDWSSVEARKTWLIERFRDERMRGYKFGGVAAVTRLRLDPGDTAATEWFTHLYDRLGNGAKGPMFSFPTLARALGQYWDSFTPSQRAHILGKLKGFTNLTAHGTENHALMQTGAGHLFAQYWPNESGWLNGKVDSAQLLQTTKEQLLGALRSLYGKGFVENLSPTYNMVHLYPIVTLYDCATDPEIQKAAEAALVFHATNMAVNSFHGLTLPPFNRETLQQFNQRTDSWGQVWTTNATWMHWLYWSSGNLVPRPRDIVTKQEGQYIMSLALSSWVPPPILRDLALGKGTPYTIRSCASGFGYWGKGRQAECVRSVYRHEQYAIGAGFFRYNPDEYYVDYNGSGIYYRSKDLYNYLEWVHVYWHSDERDAWPKGNQSPMTEIAHYKNTAIVLFNIPDKDPWANRGRADWRAKRDGHANALSRVVKIRYPKSIDERADSGGWVFLRDGETYIAIFPLRPTRTITDNGKGGRARDFNLIQSESAKNGFVFDVGTAEDFASLDAYRNDILSRTPRVDMNSLTVTYVSSAGHTLKAAWRQPDYGARTVEVRPDVWVNGTLQTVDTTWPVLDSPHARLTHRQLSVAYGDDRVGVDWQGTAPVFSRGGKGQRRDLARHQSVGFDVDTRPGAAALAEARALAARGEYPAAAQRLEAEARKLPDRAAEFRQRAAGFHAADVLRVWITVGAEAGRSEQTFLDLGGMRARAEVVAADEEGLTVRSRGTESRLAWRSLSPAGLYAVAKKYAAENGRAPSERQGLLDLFAQSCGIEGHR